MTLHLHADKTGRKRGLNASVSELVYRGPIGTFYFLAQKLVFHNSDLDLYNFINIDALLAIARSL
jgi:hypothetical protein